MTTRTTTKTTPAVAGLSTTTTTTAADLSFKSVEASTTANFLAIDSKRREELLKNSSSHHRQHEKRKTAKSNRRNSILKSLTVLDIDDDDNDPFSTTPNSNNMDPQQQGQPRTRYMRRGSVTKHKLDADLIGMQPTSRNSTGGDESDYGSDYDSGLDEEEKARVRALRSATPGRGRYMRRGSVTKHKLDADMMGMQPTEMASRPGDESDYGSDYDSGFDEEQKAQRRYRRRGSVTKYSLDYSSIGAGMQPANVAEGETNFSKGAVVVDKSRLPPPPSNDSFRFDDDEDLVARAEKHKEAVMSPRSTTRTHHRHHNHHGHNDDGSSTGRPPKNKTTGRRRARRGSMRMPGDDGTIPSKHAPTPGDDHYSANLDNSAHRHSNRYFDTPEQILSPRDDKHALEDDSVHVGSIAPAASGSSAPAIFHPLSPQKPRSGRRFCVDEAELLQSEEDDTNATDNHHLDTIGATAAPLGPNHFLHQARTLVRSNSNSSIESEDSEYSTASFGSESVDDFPPSKPADVSVPKAPRLPPAYSSAPKTFASSSPLLPPSMRKRRSHAKHNKKKPPSDHSIEKKRSPSFTKLFSSDASTVATTVTEDDSSSSEEDKLVASHSVSEHGATGPVHGFKNRFSSALLKRTSSADNVARLAAASATPPGVKGCLRHEDSKPTAKTYRKTVRFGRLVITEFPVILGDNPAVTSGAPVTIDWVPQGEKSYSVNAYEQCKPARRRRRKLLISVSSRAILLLAAGYTIDEIADASINAQQIKFSRQESMQANQYRERVSLLVENTNDALNGMMQNTGKKLKALIQKPVQHSETARTA
eukprot:CAMPEP_0178857760 /NCGR_PEP_ID=MMETSP0747-20121128/304_1 /TAXON_ID=913974 /ORGANISM="Nitzschia punctata, Strain CCMP561" /LENGTH=815 /DNA_ID=CAMNT_0020524013 /DNA_START=244 /DNA_END=2691 /DNA_ORIENTATION=+